MTGGYSQVTPPRIPICVEIGIITKDDQGGRCAAKIVALSTYPQHGPKQLIITPLCEY